MGLLDELYGVSPDGAADLEFRRGSKGLEAGRTPGGIQGLLADLSSGSDSVMAKIAEAEQIAKANGGRQSPLGWLLGQIMAGTVPSTVGSAARVAKAPMDYAQGRESDLRASDALLALPAAGPAGRAAAPALRMSPEVGGILASGAGGFAYGHGVASEANAAGEGGRVTMPTQRSRADFEAAYNVPRPTLRTVDEAVAAARKAYEASPAYADLIKQSRASVASRNAEAAGTSARTNYASEQAAYEKALKDWNDAREAAFTAEQGDYQKRLDAFQNQGFWDRNPDVKPYAMGAAYALPAIFGAGSAVQKGKTQQRLADAIMGDDLAKSAAAKVAADKFLNPSIGQQAMKGTGTLLAAGAPFELRSIGDAADATFAPEGSGAQKRAKEHFANPLQYLAEGAPQLLTGAMIYGMGNKAGSLATRDAKSMLAGAAATDVPAIEAAAARRGATINAQAGTDKLARDAAQTAAVENVRNRGILAEETGNAALAEQAALSALRRSNAPAGPLADQAPVAQVPAAPPSPPPQPAPVQSQKALPAPKEPQPREWAQYWSAPAREAVQEHIANGGQLSSLTGQKLMDMINARRAPGTPEASLSNSRKYLSQLKTDLGADPSERELLRHFRTNPSKFALPAVGAGASGLLDWGD